jgi:hypothetical protein
MDDVIWRAEPLRNEPLVHLRASPAVLSMWVQTVKFIVKKSKCAGLPQEIGLSAPTGFRGCPGCTILKDNFWTACTLCCFVIATCPTITLASVLQNYLCCCIFCFCPFVGLKKQTKWMVVPLSFTSLSSLCVPQGRSQQHLALIPYVLPKVLHFSLI